MLASIVHDFIKRPEFTPSIIVMANERIHVAHRDSTSINSVMYQDKSIFSGNLGVLVPRATR